MEKYVLENLGQIYSSSEFVAIEFGEVAVVCFLSFCIICHLKFHSFGSKKSMENEFERSTQQ